MKLELECLPRFYQPLPGGMTDKYIGLHLCLCQYHKSVAPNMVLPPTHPIPQLLDTSGHFHTECFLCSRGGCPLLPCCCAGKDMGVLFGRYDLLNSSKKKSSKFDLTSSELFFIYGLA